MKYQVALSIVLLGTLLSACAHETTTMDRELALKLADSKDPVIVQSAAPVVNVNIGQQSATGSFAHMPDGSPDDRQNCRTYPVYTVNGQIDRYQKECFGGN